MACWTAYLVSQMAKNLLPIRSDDHQLANEFSEYFLQKFKGISDMFDNFLPSKKPAYSQFSSFA